MKGTVTMSAKEVGRIDVFERLMRKEIKQKHAGKLLHISTRQIRTLLKRYKREGAAGIIHKLRGTIGNRRIDELIIKGATDKVRNLYPDFSPTLAHEKLTEIHGFKFCRETLRQAMITEGLWLPKKKKKLNLHQLRKRRDCLGELVQADGSPHDWFEGRNPYCTLLVFIDDATGKLLWLEFAPSESTASYFLAMSHYLKRNGKPLALYVDRHGVFRVNTTKAGTAGTGDSNGLTQFGRAMNELSIEIIYANSAEAKGRVEKANETLQDRLVKEMRLKRINTMEEGNRYLPEFMDIYNRKFAVTPTSPVNMHRQLLPAENLDNILCHKYIRILSKQLSLSYGNIIYQIQTERPTYAMRYAPVTVIEDMEGNITIYYKQQKLEYAVFHRQPKSEIADSKQLNLAIDALVRGCNVPAKVVKVPWIPPVDHPWRQWQI